MLADQVERDGGKRIAEALGRPEAGMPLHPRHPGARGRQDGLHGGGHLGADAVPGDQDNRCDQGNVSLPVVFLPSPLYSGERGRG